MAIKVRRGNYADLDKSRLVAGEPFTTLDRLPDGDYYVGMTIAPNNTVRLATWTNLETVLEECHDYAEAAEDSKDAAAISETNAENSALDSEAWAVGQKDGTDVPSTDPRYENNSKYYAELAGDYWDDVYDAVNRVTPTVSIDFNTGMLLIDGTSLYFGINQTTGFLEFGFTP